MNRESKRMMQRRGETEPGGATAVATRHEPVAAPVRERSRPRTTLVQFAREIRDELRQVAWPTRPEMVNYSTVVFFTLVLMVALIFLLNFVFGKAVFFMFQK